MVRTEANAGLGGKVPFKTRCSGEIAMISL